MTTNGDMHLQGPREDEPLEQLFGEVFALVDEAVAQITDAEVDDQLRKALSQTGYSGQLTALYTSAWIFHGDSRVGPLITIHAF